MLQILSWGSCLKKGHDIITITKVCSYGSMDVLRGACWRMQYRQMYQGTVGAYNHLEIEGEKENMLTVWQLEVLPTNPQG